MKARTMKTILKRTRYFVLLFAFLTAAMLPQVMRSQPDHYAVGYFGDDRWKYDQVTIDILPYQHRDGRTQSNVQLWQYTGAWYLSWAGDRIKYTIGQGDDNAAGIRLVWGSKVTTYDMKFRTKVLCKKGPSGKERFWKLTISKEGSNEPYYTLYGDEADDVWERTYNVVQDKHLRFWFMPYNCRWLEFSSHPSQGTVEMKNHDGHGNYGYGLNNSWVDIVVKPQKGFILRQLLCLKGTNRGKLYNVPFGKALIANDTRYSALFVPTNNANISLDANGGTVSINGGTAANIGNVEVDEDGHPRLSKAKVNPPEGTDYSFLGWFDHNGNQITEESVLTYEQTLHARWTGGLYPVNGSRDTIDYGRHMSDPNYMNEVITKYIHIRNDFSANKRVYLTFPNGKSTSAPFQTWDYLDIPANSTDSLKVTLYIGRAAQGVYSKKLSIRNESGKEIGYVMLNADVVNPHVVKFDPRGAEISDVIRGGYLLSNEDSKLDHLPQLTFGGYKFKGWFTDSVGGTKLDSDYLIMKDINLYAQWERGFNISKDKLDFGTVPSEYGPVCAQTLKMSNTSPDSVKVTMTVPTYDGSFSAFHIEDAEGNSEFFLEGNQEKLIYVRPKHHLSNLNVNMGKYDTYAEIKFEGVTSKEGKYTKGETLPLQLLFTVSNQVSVRPEDTSENSTMYLGTKALKEFTSTVYYGYNNAGFAYDDEVPSWLVIDKGHDVNGEPGAMTLLSKTLWGNTDGNLMSFSGGGDNHDFWCSYPNMQHFHNEFFNQNFTDLERTMMKRITKYDEDSANQLFERLEGNKLFPLSIKEIKEFLPKQFFKSTFKGDTCSWWLRNLTHYTSREALELQIIFVNDEPKKKFEESGENDEINFVDRDLTWLSPKKKINLLSTESQETPTWKPDWLIEEGGLKPTTTEEEVLKLIEQILRNTGEDFYILNYSVGHLQHHYQPWIMEKESLRCYRVDMTDTCGMRPAFCLYDPAVLMTSPALGGKSSNSIYNTSMRRVVKADVRGLKLTLLDPSRADFYSTFANYGDYNSQVLPGETVFITYRGARKGLNEYVSAMLVDNRTNEVLYYGNMDGNKESGYFSIDLPDDLKDGWYKLYIFSEQKNGDYRTDYASPFNHFATNKYDIYMASKPYVILSDNDAVMTPNNTSYLNKFKNFETTYVSIVGRKLYKDGAWNTLCLPFSLPTLDGTPLEGATVMELDENARNGVDVNTQTLHLTFKSATAIEAGKPYIIKWEPGGTDITTPKFDSVTVTSTLPIEVNAQSGGLLPVTFKSNYTTIDVAGGNKSILFLTEGNQLQHATEDRKLLPFRAYFQIEENAAQYVRASSLDFGNGEVTTTAIKGLGLDTESQEIYDLQGRRVHQPRKGELYIIGGQKKVY